MIAYRWAEKCAHPMKVAAEGPSVKVKPPSVDFKSTSSDEADRGPDRDDSACALSLASRRQRTTTTTLAGK